MIKAIVTDIEGTTTSLSFVKDILFPYARAHLAEFVQTHAQQTHTTELLADVKQIVGQDLTPESAITQLIDWLDQDQKITPLKTLQGMIWQQGYRQGDLKGHIYPDVTPQLHHWQQQGIALYIYSSGSVQAQKLLFAHTESGDLTPLFSGYFDTHIGGKKETTSYQRIAEQINIPAEQILFLSDITEELDAAKQAGFEVIQLVREGGALDNSYKQVASFADIAINQ